MVAVKKKSLIDFRLNAGAQTTTSLFTMCSWLYFIAFFILPDSCGFYFKMLFSAKRIMMFICYAMILFNKARLNQFISDIRKLKVLNTLVILMMVLRAFVAIYRTDINTFTSEFIDGVMVVYLFYYVLKNYISIEKFLKFIEIALYIICAFCIIEFIFNINLFNMFATATKQASVGRLSSNRVIGNCHHPILCGVYITMLYFITCIDYKKKNIYLFRKPILFAMSIITVFFTGSRGPVGIFLFSIILTLILSKRNEALKGLIILTIVGILVGLVVVLTIRTNFGKYIMRMITAAIDGVFKTELSVKYGGEHFNASTEYREALSKVFQLTYFNKFIGRGKSYVLSVVIDGVWLKSCDNSYIMTYIQLAYPGLIWLIAFMLSMAIFMIVGMFKYKDRRLGALLVVLIGYACNVYTVAFMGSFMYVWALFAIILILFNEKNKNKEIKNGEQNN